ncbi:unnamed protein product, partial [Closterium sp. Naga37s-1]
RPIGGSMSKGGSAIAFHCSCREHRLSWPCPSPSCTSPSSRWSKAVTQCAPSSPPSTCMPAVPTLPSAVRKAPTLPLALPNLPPTLSFPLSHPSFPPSPTLSFSTCLPLFSSHRSFSFLLSPSPFQWVVKRTIATFLEGPSPPLARCTAAAHGMGSLTILLSLHLLLPATTQCPGHTPSEADAPSGADTASRIAVEREQRGGADESAGAEGQQQCRRCGLTSRPSLCIHVIGAHPWLTTHSLSPSTAPARVGREALEGAWHASHHTLYLPLTTHSLYLSPRTAPAGADREAQEAAALAELRELLPGVDTCLHLIGPNITERM